MIFLFYPISRGCKPIPTGNGIVSAMESWSHGAIGAMEPLQFMILPYVFGIVNITILPLHIFFPRLSQLYKGSATLIPHLHMIGIL